MGLPLQKNGRYSYADYSGWPDEFRCELIDGLVYDMSPAPGTLHQESQGRLYAALLQKMKGHRCRVFIAPHDVVLSDFNVVQPDIFVVCKREQITEKCIRGAPDVVIELLSPATALKDRRDKKELYQKYGVLEYVLVHPTDQFAEHFVLVDGRYAEPAVIAKTEILRFDSLDGLEVLLEEAFNDLSL